MSITSTAQTIARFVPFRGSVSKMLLPIKARIRKRRVAAYLKSARAPAARPSVLLVADIGIGNAIEATPAVQAIRMLFPRGYVAFMSPYAELFQGWCVPDCVCSSFGDLRGRRFDRTLVTWMSNLRDAPPGIEFGQVVRPHCLLGMPVAPERELDLHMARAMGYSGPCPPLYVSMVRPGVQIQDGWPIICIAPAGKKEHHLRHKRWPYFAELAKTLLDAVPTLQIRLIGGKDDEGDGFFPEAPGLVDLRGRLTLSETAWVLRQSALAVGNDCGPMHIADAVRVPSIVLFGPTCELKNGPWQSGIPMSSDLKCRPCQFDASSDTCTEGECMKRLSAELVAAKALELLRGCCTTNPACSSST